MLFRNRLQSGDNLAKRNVAVSGGTYFCMFCGIYEESISHFIMVPSSHRYLETLLCMVEPSCGLACLGVGAFLPAFIVV